MMEFMNATRTTRRPVGPQERVQPIEDDAGLDGDRRTRRIEFDHLVQVLRVIDNERRADRLAALISEVVAESPRLLRTPS